MSGESEAAGDVLTGGIVAHTVEGDAGSLKQGAQGDGACRNCGTELTGAFCAACGQSAHIHRSLASIGHDILHGVFHFEGKIWRTIPELFFHPGRLTRRYIDGERAKFVSPMALYLFTVFLMFAVFSFTSDTLLGTDIESLDPKALTSDWQAAPLAATLEKIEALRKQREAPDVPAQRRAAIDKELAELESARQVMEALGRGDFERLKELDAQSEAGTQPVAPSADAGAASPLGNSAFARKLGQTVQDFTDNPRFLLYKLKTNGYKFSWALVPLSLPFLWLLFFWRRDIHLYDHAIFTTYSISFMMLLMILLSVAAAVGVPSGVWGTVLAFAPPIHLYKQLRGAYGLSRAGAAVRLFFLMLSILVVLTLFSAMLVAIGVLG